MIFYRYSELLKLSYIFHLERVLIFLLCPGRPITDLKFSTYRQKNRDLVILPLVSWLWLSVSCRIDLLFVYQAILWVVCVLQHSWVLVIPQTRFNFKDGNICPVVTPVLWDDFQLGMS